MEDTSLRYLWNFLLPRFVFLPCTKCTNATDSSLQVADIFIENTVNEVLLIIIYGMPKIVSPGLSRLLSSDI